MAKKEITTREVASLVGELKDKIVEYGIKEAEEKGERLQEKKEEEWREQVAKKSRVENELEYGGRRAERSAIKIGMLLESYLPSDPQDLDKRKNMLEKVFDMPGLAQLTKIEEGVEPVIKDETQTYFKEKIKSFNTTQLSPEEKAKKLENFQDELRLLCGIILQKMEAYEEQLVKDLPEGEKGKRRCKLVVDSVSNLLKNGHLSTDDSELRSRQLSKCESLVQYTEQAIENIRNNTGPQDEMQLKFQKESKEIDSYGEPRIVERSYEAVTQFCEGLRAQVADIISSRLQYKQDTANN
jgi:hypothetical protein